MLTDCLQTDPGPQGLGGAAPPHTSNLATNGVASGLWRNLTELRRSPWHVPAQAACPRQGLLGGDGAAPLLEHSHPQEEARVSGI